MPSSVRQNFELMSLHLKENEQARALIFFVILFACGIGSYFTIKFEPDYDRTLIGLGISFLVVIFSIFSKHRKFYPALFIFAFALGFFAANTKAYMMHAPRIDENLGTIWLRGKLEDIDKKDSYHRILVSKPDLWRPDKGKFTPEETPMKIRLNVRTAIADDVNEGDIIKARVKLNQPAALPAYPNGYDFARYAYFEGIGAVGFAFNKIEVFKDRKQGYFSSIRDTINKNIEEKVEDKDNAEILKALITAERGGIDRQVKESIREAGLGHVLAISGMHMSIACIWFFTILRIIMALFPGIALRFDTKKIAAIFAFGLGFFYLMITNMPVSATRAYIMIAMFLIAILIDRTNQPMRPVAIAALLILSLNPESLVTPGFQMSFAAVICLIGIYELIFKNFHFQYNKDRGMIKMFFIYLLGVSATTLIASLATSPYAVYHFGKIPKYSVISNLIAIPALTFIALPLLFLSVILMPFGAEAITLHIAEFGVDVIRNAADYVSTIEGNLISKPALPNWFLWYSSISMVWFFAFRSKLRYAAIPFIVGVYGIILFYDKTPYAVISDDLKHFVIKQYDGNFKFYGRKSSGYKISRWAEELGIDKDDINFASKAEKLECNSDNCIAKPLVILQKFDALYCNLYKFIIISGDDYGECKSGITKVFNKRFLQQNGTLLLYENGDFKTSRQEAGIRFWNY